MRLDVVTIFPEYLAPLDLSLIGKARRDGLLSLSVHDLRTFTHDRHRTVDDTPYGGGAGMVMRPEPWAEALTHVAGLRQGRPRLVVPGPGGTPFTQAAAHRLASEPWLVFACGRYEGIDERVYEWAAERMDVEVVSLGDYVLNGGEVAVLAIVEAVARLLPGVVGNAESLVEESHEDGLLEYPVYTKPASWDGRDVPPVLLGGDHGAISSWRHRQRLERTAARRPDLLAAQPFGLADLDWRPAVPGDAGELFTLTKACWVREIQALGTTDFPPVTETLADTQADLAPGTPWRTWVGRVGGRLVASVRGRELDGDWLIGRLMVAPDLQGRGIGREVLAFAEQQAPPGVAAHRLVVGARSRDNQRMYRKAGYRPAGPVTGQPQAAWMRKSR